MGRYSTVQAFADTNPNMRKVTYEQAAGAPSTDSKKSSAVRPEKVKIRFKLFEVLLLLFLH